ncbi:Hypothetical predicted protein [Podarcis lilfordi]|uniref:Uncharacterized protein n=1 Tax=Podarcis lilfordi TaxID=74358 RepID=A0AA35L529_9SAUR|nr:Hypothetical predicted protein [Podarcis lilfordi]
MAKQCKPKKTFGKYKDYHSRDVFSEIMMGGNTPESGGPGWPQQLGFQQSNLEGDLRPYPSFGGGSSSTAKYTPE